MTEKYVLDSCSGGFHIYRDRWSPSEDQTLETAKERDNSYDKYAVAVVLNKVTVGHLPKEISRRSASS